MKQSSKEIPRSRVLIRWSNVLHLLLNFLLPIVLLIFIKFGLIELAIVIALASKWRMFTVRPRHFIANIRANLVDIIVKLSTLIFIIGAEPESTSLTWGLFGVDDLFTISDFVLSQVVWTAWYIVWLTYIKPKSSKIWMGIQALVAQGLGITAIYQFSEDIDQITILVLVWLVATACARHFLSNFEDEWSGVITQLWGLFAFQLAWILNNWLLVYLLVPQIAIILTILGYAAGSLYDASKQEVVKRNFVIEQVVITAVILITFVVLSDWQATFKEVIWLRKVLIKTAINRLLKYQ